MTVIGWRARWSAIFASRCAIVGEFVGSNGAPPSLGYLVLRSARAADTGQTFAAIACSALLALSFYAITRALQRRFTARWHAGGSP